MAGCQDGPAETVRVGNVVSWLATVVKESNWSHAEDDIEKCTA